MKIVMCRDWLICLSLAHWNAPSANVLCDNVCQIKPYICGGAILSKMGISMYTADIYNKILMKAFHSFLWAPASHSAWGMAHLFIYRSAIDLTWMTYKIGQNAHTQNTTMARAWACFHPMFPRGFLSWNVSLQFYRRDVEERNGYNDSVPKRSLASALALSKACQTCLSLCAVVVGLSVWATYHRPKHWQSNGEGKEYGAVKDG